MSSNTSWATPASNTSWSNPKKSTGQFHSVKGTLVEGLGNLTKQKKWQEQGQREHTEGEAELHAAKTKGYVEGTQDRAGGWKDSILGAFKGDKSQQMSGNARREQGEKKQEFNK